MIHQKQAYSTRNITAYNKICEDRKTGRWEGGRRLLSPPSRASSFLSRSLLSLHFLANNCACCCVDDMKTAISAARSRSVSRRMECSFAQQSPYLTLRRDRWRFGRMSHIRHGFKTLPELRADMREFQWSRFKNWTELAYGDSAGPGLELRLWLFAVNSYVWQ